MKNESDSGFDGPVSKRQKTEHFDPHKTQPSPVLHVRGLGDAAIEADLVEAVQHFGSVKDIIMIPRKKQALIEFDDISSAKNCVEYVQNSMIYVAGQPAYFNFSTSLKIQRPGDLNDSRPSNHVLLFTILNPHYPINTDVMHTICSPYGTVLRIVIFKKNGVQAMVEFDGVESAKRAKQSLNGADVYSGCCTLKIEFAKPSRLNVKKNDNESWDYTNPNPGSKDSHQRGQPLLQEPRFGNTAAPYNGPADMHSGGGGGVGGGGVGGGGNNAQAAFTGAGNNYGCGYGGFEEYDGAGGTSRGHFSGPSDRFSGPKQDRFDPGSRYGEQTMNANSSGGQGCVVMVYSLSPEKMNCDTVFNLFCLYGNVVRVKFLKTKEGSAMVQLGDIMSVERAIQNLHNCVCFENELRLSHSKQAYLQDVPNPYELADGTPSFKDFMGCRNNRFQNLEAALKNRIQSPSKVLHFYNAPPNLTEEELMAIFDTTCGKRPVRVKHYPSKSERSSSGLIEFENKSDAIEALILTNHHPISMKFDSFKDDPFHGE